VRVKEIQGEKLQLNEAYSVEIFHSINDIQDFWAEATKDEDIFLSVDYLRSVEECPPSGIICKYALLYQRNELVAYFPMQISQFEAEESINNVGNDESAIRKSLAKCVKFNALVAGNTAVSGEYMFRFVKEGFTPKEKFELLELVLSECKEYFSTKERPLTVVFSKDFPEVRSKDAIGVTNTKFAPFSVEPLMVFHIDEKWDHFSDYLSALTSKYRVRAKRAFKKSAHLTFSELSLEQIDQRQDEYYEHYLEVLKGINFSLFKLPKDYFVNLKKHLGDDFHFIIAENSDGKLLGFYTLIHNKGELHAHFLGYDKDTNRTCQLYLTMLYRMINFGIENKFKLIDFGRTALEIKSSVGAVPHNYELYIKHTNTFANLFVKPILNILNKKTDWEARHPYKV